MADSTVTAVNTQTVQPQKTEISAKTPPVETAKTITPPIASASTPPPQQGEQGKKLDVVA